MKTKHTPTPWVKLPIKGECSISPEDFRYILKCVNMHDAIVNKLVTSLSALTSLDKENQFEDLRENIERLIEKAKE